MCPIFNPIQRSGNSVLMCRSNVEALCLNKITPLPTPCGAQGLTAATQQGWPQGQGGGGEKREGNYEGF